MYVKLSTFYIKLLLLKNIEKSQLDCGSTELYLIMLSKNYGSVEKDFPKCFLRYFKSWVFDDAVIAWYWSFPEAIGFNCRQWIIFFSRSAFHVILIKHFHLAALLPMQRQWLYCLSALWNSECRYVCSTNFRFLMKLKGPFLGLRQFLLIESPLKMMKNAFHFIWKALFIFEIFTFFSWLFGYVVKRLDKKLRLISKFMTSQTGQQMIIIRISTNVLRSKGNHAMKFGHLIKYSKNNIFLLESCRKWGRETSSRPLFDFQKKH